jgi:putative transposase
MLRATKIRIFPTIEQQKLLDKQFGACRFVYNKALHIKNHYYKVRNKNVSKNQLSALLPIAKNSEKYSWLKEFDAWSLQHSIGNLDNSFQRFFKKLAKYPKFKRKYGKQTSTHATGKTSFNSDSITIPKIGTITAVVHRKITGKLKSITLSKNKTNKYFASVLTDNGLPSVEVSQSLDFDKVLGIDLGLKDFSVDSNKVKIPNPKFMKQVQHNLRRKQKALSRKQKGSKNRSKARIILAKVHERVTNCRADFQHKLTHLQVVENQAICVEKLKVGNMLKNHKLAKAIAEVGWYSYRSKLEYKCKKYGKHFVMLNQWEATSKTCSDCGFRLSSLSLSVRNWTCENCGSNHDRDINAALNIKQISILELKASGVYVSVCGGLSKTRETWYQPVKQETQGFRP